MIIYEDEDEDEDEDMNALPDLTDEKRKMLEDLDDSEDIYLSEQVLIDIRSGNQKTYPAEEVFKEAGL